MANITKAPLPTAEFKHVVTITNGKPMTTSLMVADKFGKRHRDVLRAIRNMECSTDYRERNFAQSSFINEQGKEQPCYNITRDGFLFLGMGFTGKEAAQWKETFITAFNAMEHELVRLDSMTAAEWAQARIEGKAARREETDAIKDLVEYAFAHGSTNAPRYYGLITNAVYKELFILDPAEKVARDQLTSRQLSILGTAECVISKAINEAIAVGQNYRQVYVIAVDKVRQFAGLVGKTVPGAQPNLLNG
jgi:Rha family phage regulatory protein